MPAEPDSSGPEPLEVTNVTNGIYSVRMLSEISLGNYAPEFSSAITKLFT